MPAMAPSKPTIPSRLHPPPRRNWLASEGALTANHSLATVPKTTVGAGLPAMAPSQPTNRPGMHPIHCGSQPAGDSALTANHSLTTVPNPL
jgi:hypothetical protein